MKKMKWTNEQVEKLKELCFAEKTNSVIAKHFDVPVTEIYAKRSQLGITIDKVAAAKGIEEKPEYKTLGHTESKEAFISALGFVISKADKTIAGLNLSDSGNIVEICYNDGGCSRKVDITGDSRLAIIFDIARTCLR
jgi:hypothetical protein